MWGKILNFLAFAKPIALKRENMESKNAENL